MTLKSHYPNIRLTKDEWKSIDEAKWKIAELESCLCDHYSELTIKIRTPGAAGKAQIDHITIPHTTGYRDRVIRDAIAILEQSILAVLENSSRL